MNFFLEVLIGGLLSGVMYALVALGFVMIYKASGVFNFAQGAMVYLAALSVVGCMEKGAPLWMAIILAFLVMTLFGIATEKYVLRKLVNQPPIALFMATIGLAFFIEGLAPMIFGSEPRALDLGIVDEPLPWVLDNWNMVISKFDLVASGVGAVLVPRWPCSSNTPGLAGPCGPWLTITRQHCRSVSRFRTSGRLSGVSQALSHWSPA